MRFLRFTYSILLPLTLVGAQVKLDLIAIEKERVLSAAEKYLTELPITITAFPCERSAGGIHDYYSEGDYWWPDSTNPNGPYIQRDGLSNPNNFIKHRQLMWRLSIMVPALVAAYKISGDIRYANRAIEHLWAWFVDPATRMNPNLLYSQAIKGRFTGRAIGIIDTIHLVEVVRAVQILADNNAIYQADLDAVKEWFRQYLEWLFTAEYGIAERDNGNNHSTCWAMQVAAYASLVDDQAKLNYCRQFYKTVLLPGQMAADGSFPRELKRTKPFGYSLFNLDAMAILCQVLSIPTDNLWQFTTADGRGMRRAVAYMYPYVADKSRWQLPPDVMYFDYWPVRHPFLLFAGIAFQEQKYLDLWQKLNPDPNVDEVIRNFPVRQPLLWIDSLSK